MKIFTLTILFAMLHVSADAQNTMQNTMENATQNVKSNATVSLIDAPEPVSEDASVLDPANTPRRLALGDAEGDWSDLLEQHITEFSDTSDRLIITPALLRKLRSDIGEILATQGYFSPLIHFRNSGNDRILVDVLEGERTTIASFSFDLFGAMEDRVEQGNQEEIRRKKEMLDEWDVRVGDPFIQKKWSNAKDRLLDAVRSETYAAASMIDSRAMIDAQTNSGALNVAIDSGPPFTFGPLQINGLEQYPSWLLERYHPPQVGEVYSRSRLLEYQRALQNSPFFSTVGVSINPDPDLADKAPVEVSLVERKARDLGFGTGYSTNTGYRAEISYRDRNIFNKAWDLRSAVRLEQLRQIAYADVYLPPRDGGNLDSFGVLLDNQNLSGLKLSSAALGAKRTSTHGSVEQRLGINFTHERSQLGSDPADTKKALVASAGWTWRGVDNFFFPRDGQIVQLDFAGSEKVLISDQSFLRIAGKYQRWLPAGAKDSVILRAEFGQIIANQDDGIPEDYLFRTGGSSTVRGYAYQSLGVQHPNGVTGGRVMGVASAEYVHWVKENWGVATFIDVGDAAERWRDFHAKQSVGLGVRYKTPAGPIALDLAYGVQSKGVRLAFSIAIAF